MNHPDRVVRVLEAPRSQKPSWGGFVPARLEFETCQRMTKLLIDDAALPCLEPSGRSAIEMRREEMRDLLQRGLSLQIEDGSARWWTFAPNRRPD